MNRVNCENCNNSIKLSFWFWGYKVKCNKCGHITDFRNHKELFVPLAFYNSLVIMILLAINYFIRPIIEEKYGISSYISIPMYLIIVAMIALIIIIPIYQRLLIFLLRKLDKQEK